MLHALTLVWRLGPAASAATPGIAAELEQARTSTPQEKAAYGELAVKEMGEWVKSIEQLLAAATKEGDSQKLECLQRRLSPLKSIYEVTKLAKASMVAASSRNDKVHAEQDWRKVAVAHDKARSLREDALACVGAADVNRAGNQASILGQAENLVDTPTEAPTITPPDPSPG